MQSGENNMSDALWFQKEAKYLKSKTCFVHHSFVEHYSHKAVGYINTIRSKKSNYELTNIEIRNTQFMEKSNT